MKERDSDVISLPYDKSPEKTVAAIERQVKKKWDQGWTFVNAEPDLLGESVRINYERIIAVD